MSATRRAFALGTLAALGTVASTAPAYAADEVDTIVYNAKVVTLDEKIPNASAFAIVKGVVALVGSDSDILSVKTEKTRLIDAKGRTVIPGLNDSHIHLIRGGLNYNLELRWDGVPSLVDALRMLKTQAARTPAPQWVRVVGGWSVYQFAEKRLPTLDEINDATGDVPAFILNLYDVALLNRAALRALGYTKATPAVAGGEIARDAAGNPTGMLVAKPSPALLLAALAQAPKLSAADQENSTRLFMRELNRLGVTSAGDAGGLGQSYPQDYAVFTKLAKQHQITVRTAYSLQTQHPGEEQADFSSFVGSTRPQNGDAYFRQNGAGEIIVYAADDHSNFAQDRPPSGTGFGTALSGAITVLAENNWPFHLHATYDPTISQILDVLEKVNKRVPFNAPFWLDHAETISEKNIARVAALGGGITVQDRLAFQGEALVQRYGAERAQNAPPVRQMLSAGVMVGAGTDATRLSSYNPWVALYWLVTQRTVGGLQLSATNTLSREDALRCFTKNGAWFSGEEKTKGTIAAGMTADIAILSADFLHVPEKQIPTITSELTMVGGAIVHAQGDFIALAPPALAASPSWSPITVYGAAHQPVVADTAPASAARTVARAAHAHHGPLSYACCRGG